MVLLLTAVTVLTVTASGPRLSALRIVVGLLFVLFVPGYVVVAALFPERSGSGDSDGMKQLSSRGLNGVERFALSLGLSVALVPLLGLLLNLSPARFDTVSVLMILTGLTVVTAVIAIRRRLALPRTRRFRLPYRRWLRGARGAALRGSPSDALLVIVIVVSLLVAGIGVAGTITSPGNAETYTELYVLNEGPNGVVQATNYTTDLASGEEHSIVIGIGNNEGQAVEYTVIVRLQRMQVGGNTTTAVGSETLARFETTVESNRTVERSTVFTPTTTGEDLRLQFLLFRGDAPATPSAETAYRETHLWVTVR